MRPGQNKRMRGRPTNGRRGPNPLTRSYEFKRTGRENSRECAARSGEIPPAGARRPHGRRSGRCGKLLAARRALFPDHRRRAGGPGDGAKRAGSPDRGGRRRRTRGRRRLQRAVGPVRLAVRARGRIVSAAAEPFRVSRSPPTLRNPSSSGRRSRATGKVRTIAADFSLVRTVRAIAFPTAGRVRTASSATAATDTATIGKIATAGRATSAPIVTLGDNRRPRRPRARARPMPSALPRCRRSSPGR